MKDIFPKLPDQDDFLLNLQNSNYSMQTIYNYARDLCIFAVYIHFINVDFKNVTKRDISNYKGYLRAGEHLKDLDKIRGKVLKNVDIPIENKGEAPRGDLRASNDMGGMNTPLDGSEKEKKDTGVFETDFLGEVYSKVYGGLGIYGKPINVSSRKNSGLDFSSINRMLSSLRSYLKFRISWDLDFPLAPDAIEMSKSDKRVKKVASLKDLTRLIEAPMEFEKDEKVAIRNRCMLEVLFATGLRISELIGLDIEKINSEGKMYVVGKGKKERAVFLTVRSLDWLNKYLGVRLRYAFTDRDEKNQPVEIDVLTRGKENTGRETYPDGDRKYIEMVEGYRKSGYLKKFDSPALFIPFSGGRAGKPDARISTNYFQEKIAEYRRKLGIQIPTSAHSLRHGYATYMAEKGASPVALQALLGHESLNTTSRYVHASEKFAEETVRKNHPLK